MTNLSAVLMLFIVTAAFATSCHDKYLRQAGDVPLLVTVTKASLTN